MAINTCNAKDMLITTTEMHTGGEPLRIIESGFPDIEGETILDKRRFVTEKLDHLRKLLIFEPRGHYDMYGALLVTPNLPGMDIGVLFMHNAGYSTMCGHAVIALGRYAVDKGMVKMTEPETEVNIQCPCGPVKAFVNCHNGRPRNVRFHSVPAFAFATDVQVDVEPYGTVYVDVGYGGAFYALLPASTLGLSVTESSVKELRDAATKVTKAVQQCVTLRHPDSPDLCFVYGTILTDGRDVYHPDVPTHNVCVFADQEVDRSPTGSGVTARIAVQYHRGLIAKGQTRAFRSVTGSQFSGSVVREVPCGEFNGVIVEVSGEAFYTGTCSYTKEDEDNLGAGFLLK